METTTKTTRLSLSHIRCLYKTIKVKGTAARNILHILKPFANQNPVWIIFKTNRHQPGRLLNTAFYNDRRATISAILCSRILHGRHRTRAKEPKWMLHRSCERDINSRIHTRLFHSSDECQRRTFHANSRQTPH